MQKKLIPSSLLLAITLIATLSLNSCSDFDNGFDEATIKYNQNFLDRYGPIDPNHDWGFGEIGSLDEIGGGKATRATIETNNNMLIQKNQNTNEWEANPDYFKDTKLDIPGMPFDADGDADGGHYYIGADGYLQGYEPGLTPKTRDEFNKIEGNYLPGIHGDVTDEEIAYVSAWFRTHKSVPSDKVRFSEFFIQHISIDKDRINYGEMLNEGQSNWEETELYPWELNGDIESKNNPGEYPTGIAYSMDQLKIEVEGIEETSHVNNFNGNENPISENNAFLFKDGKKSDRIIQYWHADKPNEYTTSFSYRNSNTWDRNWTYLLKHLEFTLGEHGERHYSGFYLGFDYWGSNEDGGKTADGYYSNWIVKLSPGRPDSYYDEDKEERPEPKPDPTPSYYYRRIMCEDLGNTNDFDFNDLVFDVYYTGKSGNYTANITVQAAGGTLPIYIGEPKADNSNEAHKILGQPGVNGKYTPIINKGGHRTTVDLTISGLENTNPDNIKIYVADPVNKDATKEIKLPKDEASMVPQKICVGTDLDWTEEHQQIEELHPEFLDWVKDSNYTWWDYDETQAPDVSDGDPDENEDDDDDDAILAQGYKSLDFSIIDGAYTITSTSFAEDYKYGAWVKIVFANETTSEFTMNINDAWGENGVNRNIQVPANTKEFTYDLTALETAQLAQSSPLKFIISSDNKIVKVYMKAKTVEEVYGTPVEYEETTEYIDYNTYNKYIISADKLPTAGAVITFIPQQTDGFSYTFDVYDWSENLYCQKGGVITKPISSGIQTDVILWTRDRDKINLQVFIKPTSSAKKRTTPRK